MQELLKLINQLNQQSDRKYPATYLHKVCECVAGQRFSDRTFRRWKVTADVVEFRRDLLWGECLVLCAIAYLKRGNLHRPVTPGEIVEALRSAPLSKMLGEFVTGEIQVGITGAEVADIIRRRTGRSWSRSSLYRKIPGFSRTATYYAADIDRILFFLGQRETETIA